MSASENGHTPGPWPDDAGAASDSTVVFAVEELEEEWPSPVADCNDFDGNRPLEERRANARLIAAAPELLEALKKAKETIRAWHGPNAWEIYDRSSPEMQAINAAISKAEGGAA